jgi:hypothetical protein
MSKVQRVIMQQQSICILFIFASILILLTSQSLQAQCPPVECFGIWEFEPNDIPEMANQVPPMEPVCGSLEYPEDSDYFLLDPMAECFDFILNCDTFDARLQVWGMGYPEFELLATFDGAGHCESEEGSWEWDPCDPAGGHMPPWVVQISANPEAPPAMGAYQLDIIPTMPLVLPGDCAAMPLFVPDFPFSEDINTNDGFRDNALEPSPDVWYQFFLPEDCMFEAWTCEGITDFPTHLALLAEDGMTILLDGFGSGMCVEESPDRSWLSACLMPGLYYLMVEGQGAASGNVTLNMETTPNLLYPDLVAGEWGNDAESWHQRITDDNMDLNFLVDDCCDQILQVDFFHSLTPGDWIHLGTDLDGSEWREAVAGIPGGSGDGWRLALTPDQLSTADPMPVYFRAEGLLSDGSIVEAECETFYDPWLGEEQLHVELAEWNTTYSDTFMINIIASVPAEVDSVRWELKPKANEFVKGVPPVDQRRVSDTHCAPTAAAACLGWFAENGDPGVTGGLSLTRLTRRLGRLAKTNVGEPGTDARDLANALRQWLANHGNDYTVRGPMAFNWNRVRAELEQGQDVLIGFIWPDSSGHRLTLNSIHNEPNADSTVTVDFMDPWTGEIEYGKLNPTTGEITEYGDNPNYENLNAHVADNVIIICPGQGGGWWGGGGGGGIGGWVPWPPIDHFPIVITDPGLHFLNLIYHDIHGKVRKETVIVDRRLCPAPEVNIEYDINLNLLTLSWSEVTEADQYHIYCSTDPGFNSDPGQLCGTTTDTTWSEEVTADELFYRVVSDCEAP